ncbi:hypothetical protein DFR58_1504 [Anaerobacterium chartisolvens]|uniref:Uncharacterized protein n=2 Tax=Anaerobacterium chartisolvens TaxID=1297424 RepID=A0A369AJM5_9FIRM|nr:hypothetical protein DFR58_1504 [Anaerobacterium chartisolvens]
MRCTGKASLCQRSKQGREGLQGGICGKRGIWGYGDKRAVWLVAWGTCLTGIGGSRELVETESAAAGKQRPGSARPTRIMQICRDASGSVGPACTGRGRRGRRRVGAVVLGSVNVRRLMCGRGHGEAPAAVEGLGRGLWGGRGKSRDGEAVPIYHSLFA